jgi:hypothetical protein
MATQQDHRQGQMNAIVAFRGTSSGASPFAAPPPSRHRPDAPVTIEIRPLQACADIRAAWADLAGRAVEPNLFFEPDFALAAAQHLIAFRDAVAILAWQGEVHEPQRRLIGLIPCFPRNRLFVPDELIGFSDRRVLDGAPLLDRLQAQAVIEAVLSLRAGWRLEGRGLILRRIALEGPLATALLSAAERLGLAAMLQPARPAARPRLAMASRDKAEAFAGALARQGKVTLLESGARIKLRDAVELLLAMEASGPRARAGQAMLQNTREAGFVRAMTRGLARARQCRVALLKLDERPIAGAILLGRGEKRWLFASAQDDLHAPFEPELVLMAMLREASPSRRILLPDGEAAFGAALATQGEIRLMPRDAMKPRDLAARARDVLRRSLFRLSRAGAA